MFCARGAWRCGQAALRCALCRCGRECQAAKRRAGKSKVSCNAKHWYARCCVCAQPLRRCPHATPGQVRHVPSTRGARVAHQACQAHQVHRPRCACKALVARSGRPLRIRGAFHAPSRISAIGRGYVATGHTWNRAVVPEVRM